MDRTKRLLLLVTASCLLGQGSRLANAQAPGEPPALVPRVRVKLRKVAESDAMSASDLAKTPELNGQDVAQIQAALDYLVVQGFLLQTDDGKYYDQITHNG